MMHNRYLQSILTGFSSLFIALLFTAQVFAAETTGIEFILNLADENEQPISKVWLQAYPVDQSLCTNRALTNSNGVAVFTLPPGAYYFYGKMDTLKNHQGYITHKEGDEGVSLCYISPPTNISTATQQVILTVDKANYMDIADIGGIQGFKLLLKQSELGINAVVEAAENDTWLRLHMPMRVSYTVQHVDGILHAKWVVYATPGMQFIIAAP